MKPPVDWSPCQQKGEEHDWRDGPFDSYYCIKCGVAVYWNRVRDAY